MSEDGADQYDGPVIRDVGDQPVMVALYVEDIAIADPIHAPSVHRPHIGEGLPLGLFDYLVPCPELVLRIGVARPKLPETFLGDGPHPSSPCRV
jgi:hypothetical protein